MFFIRFSRRRRCYEILASCSQFLKFYIEAHASSRLQNLLQARNGRPGHPLVSSAIVVHTPGYNLLQHRAFSIPPVHICFQNGLLRKCPRCPVKSPIGRSAARCLQFLFSRSSSTIVPGRLWRGKFRWWRYYRCPHSQFPSR